MTSLPLGTCPSLSENRRTMYSWLGEHRIGIDWTTYTIVVFAGSAEYGDYRNVMRFDETPPNCNLDNFPSDQLITEVALALRSMK